MSAATPCRQSRFDPNAPITDADLALLKRLLQAATPRPWVFELVVPSEFADEDGGVAWSPSQAHHTVIDWDREDRELVHAVLRLLPKLLNAVEDANHLMERLDDAGLEW